jgi:hypothetical protein
LFYHGSIMSSALTPASTFWIPVMTGRARGRIQCLCMAVAAGGAAVVDSPATFIGNTRMWTIVAGIPIIGCMAGFAIQTKHACMESWVAVTACTVSG